MAKRALALGWAPVCLVPRSLGRTPASHGRMGTGALGAPSERLVHGRRTLEIRGGRRSDEMAESKKPRWRPSVSIPSRRREFSNRLDEPSCRIRPNPITLLGVLRDNNRRNSQRRVRALVWRTAIVNAGHRVHDRTGLCAFFAGAADDQPDSENVRAYSGPDVYRPSGIYGARHCCSRWPAGDICFRR